MDLRRPLIGRPHRRDQVPAAGAAPQAHRRGPRIVDEGVRVLIAGPLPAEDAVPVERVGRPLAVEEELGNLGPPERPLALLPPPVLAHDEDAHGRIVGDAVLDAPEPVVEPAHLPVVDPAPRLGAEVPPGDDRRPGDVVPGADHDPLSGARAVVGGPLAQSLVVPDAPVEKDVVPPGDVQRGNADVRVAALDAPPLPVLVARGMRQPVEEPGRDAVPPEQLIPLEGQGPKLEPGRAEGREELRFELAEFPPARGVLGQHHRPGLSERQVEGARPVRPAVVVFGGRRPGHEARQVRRGGDRREQLGRADVGDPVHAHPPVRLREPRGPLDRVVAVLGLVRERVPLPLAAPPAADVLDRDDVPAPGVPQRVRVNGVLRLGLTVRGPHEQHRKGPGALRSIHVRKQGGAVAHPHRDVARDRDVPVSSHRRILLCLPALHGWGAIERRPPRPGPRTGSG